MTDNPDLHCGRGWLARASDVLTGAEDYLSAVEYAHAAAVIGNGYIQLAAVERTTAWRAEDLARWTADREAERENNEVVREVNLLALTRERGELALVEQRTEALAALDVAALAASGQRQARAAAEARPHDDEPEMTLGEALRHPLGHSQPGDPVPGAEQPRGEAAYLLEGDDEIFTAEPKPPRCTGCFGPFSDGTHGPGCTQRCQDCHGAPDGPGACHCRDEALRADRHAEITEAEASEARDRG